MAPRYHHQLYPNSLELENGFSSAISEKLASYGHQVRCFCWRSSVRASLTTALGHSQINQLSQGATTSVVQAISRESDGYLYGASDPRKAGLAAGY